jgi:Spy/CpxP family protein refolding chaperone
MKKMTVITIAFGLAVSLFTLANAGNNGMGGGCGNCVQNGGAAPATVAAPAPSDQMRKFQADTIDLRQEMMTKRFEMQRENLKGVPDAAKIAALKAEVKALQAKLLALRSQSGLPDDKCDGECNLSMGGCDKMSMGGCVKGQGGCNSGPCGQKQ